MGDPVDWAESAISYETFVRQADGIPIPQSSSPKIIAAMLRLLDVQPGMRVLEVGTGSGYSTAMLAYLVGKTGYVVSLDIDSDLVERATRLLTSQGFDMVKVVAKDGREGYLPAAPFDRLIVWATGDALSPAWVEQVRKKGVIVAPIRLLPLANTTAITRVWIDCDRIPKGEKLIPGGFVPLSNQPRYQWHGYAEEADLAVLENYQPVAWVSSQWLRSEKAAQHKPKFLYLLQTACRQDSPLQDNEDVMGLRAYLLANNPHGLTTASTPSLGLGSAIGISQPDSLALLSEFDHAYVKAGTDAAAITLASWIDNWRAVGKPGFEQLRLILNKIPSRWTVQAKLPLFE
ncbi:protein-L-isoaspartate O-methyltransferase [Chlorogloeopsis fritschii PCC 9212]|uniref:Protein-L-isoaspartate O-methyltransferase n=1 Tax=Chlorogloeopsis fritschii PCC 6912 TaxID=211165 RepID=A0A3S0XLT9_CHLFR|nr:methyltransferase domain-containing protein [Chlorogloeopsis fritschii]RUR72959.1 hypothetical protein PCC6912_59570 [Chlorogloeopsis fritschii PCC 6912]